MVSQTQVESFASQARMHLLKYLEPKISATSRDDIVKDINTVFIKLILTSPSPSLTLEQALNLVGTNFHAQDLETWLTERSFYNSLGILYSHIQMPRKALKIWSKLGAGEYKDGTNTGIPESIALLRKTSDPELIWTYSPWLLEKVPEKAIKIFTAPTPQASVSLSPDQVIDFLAPYGLILLQYYLEYVVESGISRESGEIYSTRLALLYVDTVFTLAPELAKRNIGPEQIVSSVPSSVSDLNTTSETVDLGIIRGKLVRLLEISHNYNPHTVLSHIQNSSLWEELLRVYARLDDYVLVFKIIVWVLKDHKRAERICTEEETLGVSEGTIMADSKRSAVHLGKNTEYEPMTSQRKNTKLTKSPPKATSKTPSDIHSVFNIRKQMLFLTLLKIYLLTPDYNFTSQSPSVINPSSLSSTFPPRALELLNDHANSIDPLKVLELLPNSMAIQTLFPYLSQVLTGSVSNVREGQILKNLKKSENFQVRCQLVALTNEGVSVGGEKICPVCHKRISDKVLALFPNGIVVHYRCFTDPHVCPITGVNFLKEPKPIPSLGHGL